MDNKDMYGLTFDKMRQKIEAALNDALPADDAAGEPCRALLLSGGKRWRPLLFVLCAKSKWLSTAEQSTAAPCNAAIFANGEKDLPSMKETNAAVKVHLFEDDIYRLTPLVEFPHTASLIHDDIEDSASARRGKPCAHITYGVDAAINAASYLYFKAAECIDSAPIDDAAKCRLYGMYTDALRKLHKGQALDINWHKKKSVFPTVEQYYSMTAMKTGALASLAAGGGALAGGADNESITKIEQAAVKLGIGFQAVDDALDIEEGNPGKERGDDIVEGKKSLPVLLHLQNNPSDKEKITALFEKAHKEGITSSAVAEGLLMLNNSGAAHTAHEMGCALINEAKNEFASLQYSAGGGRLESASLLDAFIDELHGNSNCH